MPARNSSHPLTTLPDRHLRIVQTRPVETLTEPEMEGFVFGPHERPLTFDLRSQTYDLQEGERHVTCELCGGDFAIEDSEFYPNPHIPRRGIHNWCFWDYQQTHSY